SVPLVRPRRGPCRLRRGSERSIPPRGRICRPHPQGREARRSPDPGANQVPVGHQPQDRKDTWSRSPANAARPRRRGDRMIRRRNFITLIGGAAAWPLAARAQQPAKVPIIGFLGPGTPSAWSAWIAAFVQRLRELGWIEGRTLAIEYRWAEGSP